MWSALSPVSPTDSSTFDLIGAAFAAALFDLCSMLLVHSSIPNFISASRAAAETPSPIRFFVSFPFFLVGSMIFSDLKFDVRQNQPFPSLLAAAL